jgi:hypothetical protein
MLWFFKIVAHPRHLRVHTADRTIVEPWFSGSSRLGAMIPIHSDRFEARLDPLRRKIILNASAR